MTTVDPPIADARVAGRTVVLFCNDAFNRTDRRDYFINDRCFGDDVANWIAAGLRDRGLTVPSDAGQEDFGWHLGVESDGAVHDVLISHPRTRHVRWLEQSPFDRGDESDPRPSP